MKTTFADAFFFLALMNPRDAWHHAAVEASDGLPGPILTTQWVLVEVGDALANPRDRERFVTLLNLIVSDVRMQVVPASGDLFEAALSFSAGEWTNPGRLPIASVSW